MVNLISLEALKKETAAKSVTLVAVSKTKTVDEILQVYKTGHKIFGENYVRELTEKQSMLPGDIAWHYIGHLQSNKVKLIAPFISLIHGVDSLKLLREINKEAIKNNRIIDCLLQIYIAEEESKFGFDMNEAEILLNSGEITDMQNICIKGFMGMATNTKNQVQIKKEFDALAFFYSKMKQSRMQLRILSMGMTGDYKIAIEAGSTMIRIGSAIFGER